MLDAAADLPAPLRLSWSDVFQVPDRADPFFEMESWNRAIMFFVGRNGSGKSKCAQAIAARVPDTRLLSTDRLVGIMAFNNYGWGSAPTPYKGVPLDEATRNMVDEISKQSGGATVELYALREQPEVWLRVATFLRGAMHRVIELRERAGFLDPYVRVGNVEYSLLRDEGHGLRELVVLLAAVYRKDWSLLIVDEPELHLHPSLARLWLGELERECGRSQRHAIVVSHEPTLINPLSADDLEAVWQFQQGLPPKPLASFVEDDQRNRVTASLLQNPRLVSQLVFSPRPVLVEGALDVAALNTSLRRTQPQEVVAQTDLIDCGGNGGVALWFSIATRAGLDFKAVGDLDGLLDRHVQRTLDEFPSITERYRTECFIEPPQTSTVVRPLIEAMRKASVASDPKSRASWLAAELQRESGHMSRGKKILGIWKDSGLWLHEQGTLEDVLGVAVKTREAVIEAAGVPCDLDQVASWVAFSLDPQGEIAKLLAVAVEHIAHGIQEALRMAPDSTFTRPVGSSSATDSLLATVESVGGTSRHRITVLVPQDFAGQWVEFDRDTPPSALNLMPPSSPSVPNATGR
jgi:energy-coupling factor transporter ATP-binding protein EcfA2